MSFIDPLARRLEHFVYERVCALSELSKTERGSSPGLAELAAPLDGSRPGPRRR